MTQLLKELNRQAIALNEVYKQEGKVLIGQRSKSGKLRIDFYLCNKILDINISVHSLKKVSSLVKKIKNKEPVKDPFLCYLINKKVALWSIQRWDRCGLSFYEFKAIIEFFGANKEEYLTASLLLDALNQVGDKVFFFELFNGLVPKEFLLKIGSCNSKSNKTSDEQLIETAEKTTSKTVATIKRFKRYRPAYDTLPATFKELAISRRLAASLSAEREVPTPSGNIDILTADKLIEVKSGKSWKCAIGQLIAYGFHKPDKQKVLYLFDYENIDLADIRRVCASVGIEVELEPQ